MEAKSYVTAGPMRDAAKGNTGATAVTLPTMSEIATRNRDDGWTFRYDGDQPVLRWVRYWDRYAQVHADGRVEIRSHIDGKLLEEHQFPDYVAGFRWVQAALVRPDSTPDV